MPRPSQASPKGVGSLSACGDLWPGITTGFDARCWGCTWAPLDGVYQVKVRCYDCPNHGGSLASALARAARWRQGIS